MHKKFQYNFDYLICCLARSMKLAMMGYVNEKLNFQLFKQNCPKFTKELKVAIDNKLSEKTLVNEITYKKKSLSLFFSYLIIFVLNKENFLKEFISY